MADESEECVQGCEEFSRNAQKKAGKMSCAELLAKINELMDTEKRGRMGVKGLIQRFRDYLGDDATHGPQIQNQQRSLNTFIREFVKKGCGDPPDGAQELVERPLPTPASNRSSDALKVTAGASAAVGLGYIGYRVIRLLPSLAPPLWWTIPENLAIP